MKNARRNLPSISVRNLQRKIAVERGALEEFARRALLLCARERNAGLTKLTQISILLVSDRKMSQLHRRFMQLPGPTDVITFQHGDICISVETARRQAEQFRTTLLAEVQLYLVHGLLHLCGFDDCDPAARRKMERVQRRIVATALSASPAQNHKAPSAA